jgi:CelD/BcsL family acetyltransferase involved in cellulose biosynthesis
MTELVLPFDSAAADPAASGGPASASARVLDITVLRETPAFWPSAADAGGAVLHVFQTREFIAAWQQGFGVPGRCEAHLVVVANGDGQPVLLLPLAIERRRGMRVLTFMDHGHADYNAPVLFPAAGTVTAEEMAALWPRLLEVLPPVDVVQLGKMPQMIGGVANPLFGLGLAAEGESGHGNRLDRPWTKVETQFESPREIKKKQKGLAKLAHIRFITPTDPAEQRRLIAAMVEQKARRFEETGVPGYADNPGALAFLHAATESFGSSGNLVVNALMADDEPLAVQWGLKFGSTFYALVTSFTGGRWRQYSCGRILAYLLLKQCHEHGFAYFDQGVGDEAYKLRNSDTHLPLYRLVQPLSLKGRVFVGWGHLREAARQSAIGEHWRALKRARRQRAGGGPADG